MENNIELELRAEVNISDFETLMLHLKKNGTLKSITKRLETLMASFNLQIINSKEAFDGLCNRLSDTVDWSFSGSDIDYARLQSLLEKHTTLSEK